MTLSTGASGKEHKDSRRPVARGGSVKSMVEAALCRLRPDWRDRPLLIAFSGGPDSTALLLLLHELLEESGRERLRAAYVNHGLQNEAADWGEHCKATARALGVPLTCCKVEVREDGRGVEAAARRARYAALKRLMQPGECLLTAHHQDDQWETVLLRMLRGTGAAGLAGILESRRFGDGWLLRPLLDVSCARLRTWLDGRGAQYVEDPSNRDPGLDRSFLRKEVLPLLRARWPGGGATAARLARLAGETRELLRALAEQDGRGIASEDSIDCEGLLGLSPPRRANLVRERLAALGLSAPPEARLHAALDMLLNAAADRHPQARWQGVRLSRRGGRIHISPHAPADPG